jgi:hypothetical protein
MNLRPLIVLAVVLASCGGSGGENTPVVPGAVGGSGGASASGGSGGAPSNGGSGGAPSSGGAGGAVISGGAGGGSASDGGAGASATDSGQEATQFKCSEIATFADGLVPTTEIFVAPAGSDGTGDGTAGAPYATIQFAASKAAPGTAVRVRSGTYAGGAFISDLRGTAQAPIWIGGTGSEVLPVIQGSGDGVHLVRPRYLVVENLEFSGQTGNGINADDGGSYADQDAARYVVFRNVRIHDIGAGGNNDCLKLSGLNDYFVLDSQIRTCSGQGIDHVGCHRGVIARNQLSGFAAAAGPAIQAKGGSEDILITRNFLDDPGDRGINMGGSTGYEFFRPPLQTSQPNFEAKNIRVIANVIKGGGAAVAYVGCPSCVVMHNTIVDPVTWIARILQETVSDATYQFVPAAGGRFVNNLVYYTRGTLSTYEDINVGASTDPGTFVFANNLWYAHDNPPLSKPKLPVVEEGGIYGQDPAFDGLSSFAYRITAASPAAGAGRVFAAVFADYDGRCFADPPSIGAFEVWR